MQTAQGDLESDAGRGGVRRPRDRDRPRPWQTDWLVLRGLRNAMRRDLPVHLAKGSRLIDLGCGDMPYRTTIEGFGATYIGADLGDSADLQIGADGCVAMPDRSVDAVLSVQVLEHVLDLHAYCAEIRRLLRPGGTLFLSTHGTWLYHPHPQDYRRWTRPGLIAELEAQGFQVDCVEPIVGPLATTTIVRLTGFAYAFRRLPVVGRPLAGLLSLLMNARAWVEDAVTPEPVRRDNACIYWVRARPQ